MMVHGRAVTAIQGFYPIIAFGVILFYAAVVLVIFTYAIAVRLLPTGVEIPAGRGPLEGIKRRSR